MHASQLEPGHISNIHMKGCVAHDNLHATHKEICGRGYFIRRQVKMRGVQSVVQSVVIFVAVSVVSCELHVLHSDGEVDRDF